MPTRAEAVKAADVYKEHQPALDAVKDAASAVEKAKKVLGAYMIEQDINVFRGVTLALAPYEGWDYDKLRAFLGDKVSDFKTAGNKKHFGLVKRAKAKLLSSST